MRSGASNYPAELLKRAGADLDDSHTIEALVARLGSLVEALERAVDGKRRETAREGVIEENRHSLGDRSRMARIGARAKSE